MGHKKRWGRSLSGSFVVAASLVVASASLSTTGCRITEDDVSSWARKASGPRKLVAVLQHDKYAMDLRVDAGMTLVTMKPRGGRAVGLLGSDDYIGLLDALGELSVEERSTIIDGMVPKLVEGIALVPEGDEADESLPYKDAAYALLNHKDGVLIANDEAKKALTDAMISWTEHRFVERMDDTSQLYGMEQVLRLLRAPGVKGLTKLIEPDFKKVRELSLLIKELGDDATKLDASKRMVSVAKFVNSDAWTKQKAPGVEAANKASGLEVTEKQFAKQLEAYQEEELLRVFGAMKNIGQKPIVDYLLAYAENKDNPEKRRAAALAGLENNLDRKNDAHAKAMLDYLSSDDTPDSLRDVAARRVGELSREQVADRLYSLFGHERWQLRWTVASLLMKMSDQAQMDGFMEHLGKIKYMALTEPLSYGPLLKEVKGDTMEMVKKYSATSEPVPVRLSALGYYYQYGTKADLSKVEAFKSDTARVPSCPKDAQQCNWTCTVTVKDKAEAKEVSTVGQFVEYCLVPAMEGREPETKKSDAESGAEKEKK